MSQWNIGFSIIYKSENRISTRSYGIGAGKKGDAAWISGPICIPKSNLIQGSMGLESTKQILMF